MVVFTFAQSAAGQGFRPRTAQERINRRFINKLQCKIVSRGPSSSALTLMPGRHLPKANTVEIRTLEQMEKGFNTSSIFANQFVVEPAVDHLERLVAAAHGVTPSLLFMRAFCYIPSRTQLHIEAPVVKPDLDLFSAFAECLKQAALNASEKVYAHEAARRL